jgi:hypothetical protein
MKIIFLTYKTDVWHSFSSRDIIGCATTKSKAIELCKLQAEKEDETITEDELFNLDNINQTQGYSGEGEFHIEEVNINELL